MFFSRILAITVFSAKGYELVGALHEGLKSQPVHLTIPRHGTCNIIISRSSSFGFQLLKGPPRSGKTSLLQLLEKMVNAVSSQQAKVIPKGASSTVFRPLAVLCSDDRARRALAGPRQDTLLCWVWGLGPGPSRRFLCNLCVSTWIVLLACLCCVENMPLC